MKHLYSQEWIFFKNDLWKDFRWLVLFSGLLVVWMYFSFMNYPEAQGKVLHAIIQSFREKGLLGLQGQHSFLLAGKIFLTNLQATILFTLLGFVPFFLGTILFLFTISTLLGVALALSVSKGLGIAMFLRLTAPHGGFELFAVFYGATLGLYLSKEITRRILSRGRSPDREKSRPIAEYLRQWIKSYPLVIIPLLAIAALIESFITPHLK